MKTELMHTNAMKFQSDLNQTINLQCMRVINHQFITELEFINQCSCEISNTFHPLITKANASDCNQCKQVSSNTQVQSYIQVWTEVHEPYAWHEISKTFHQSLTSEHAFDQPSQVNASQYTSTINTSIQVEPPSVGIPSQRTKQLYEHKAPRVRSRDPHN